MRPRIAIVSLLVSLIVAPPALGEGGFKNLQVLPKTIAKDQLKSIMKAQSKALGVECDHCHTMPEADKDTDTKKIAREMMKMQNEINTKFVKILDKKVTCEMCHRGKEKPEITAAK